MWGCSILKILTVVTCTTAPSSVVFTDCLGSINVQTIVFQEDYRRTVTEIDEKEYISLKIIVSELRNQYVGRHLHLCFSVMCDSN